MSDLNNTHTQPPPRCPALYTILEVSRAPPSSSHSTNSSSSSSSPTKSESSDPDSASTGNPTQAINITTLNVTYGGDSYNGHIHNGLVGGHQNRDGYHSGPCRSCSPPSSISNTPSTHTPSPGTLASFAVEGTTLAFGVVGVFSVAGIALMLLRRR